MAESKALTEEHSQVEPHSGQPLSYNCLQVQGVPPNYDENDISAVVESAVGESVSVSSRRPRIHVSCRGSDAIVTMPAGWWEHCVTQFYVFILIYGYSPSDCPVPEELVLQHGQAENNKVAHLVRGGFSHLLQLLIVCCVFFFTVYRGCDAADRFTSSSALTTGFLH